MVAFLRGFFRIQPRILGTLVVAGVLGAVALPAAAQQSGEFRALAQRLQQLEAQLADLQRQSGRPASAPPPVTAAPSARPVGPVDSAAQAGLGQRVQDHDDRLNAFESELRRLTGAVETANHRSETLQTRLDRLAKDMDLRLAEIEKTMAALSQRAAADPAPIPAPAQPQTLTPPAGPAPALARPPQTLTPPPGAQTAAAPPATLADGPPEEQYNRAFGLLTALDYPAAEGAFKAFLVRHPNHELAANAQYWLGETYYARNNYAEAANAFLVGYQKYPKGTKAADNLLKLGLSLAGLGSTKEACSALGELATAYPDADIRLKRRASTEQARIGCA